VATHGRVVIAVDVGGTTIKGAAFDAAGVGLADLVVATPSGADPAATLAAVREAVRALVVRFGAGVEAVGVVVPGTVDAAAGVVGFSANLGWRELSLVAVLEADTGVPVRIDNDVRAAGLAERTVGCTVGVDDYLLAVIGTGISGEVRVAGRTVVGAGSAAGEFGHAPVWPDGELCPCGQRGCLERYASAAAISRRYAERHHTAVSESAEAIAGRRDHDPVARRTWTEAVDALAIAFASYTMVLDPTMIVIAGGLSGAGEALVAPLRIALAERVVWREPPAVRLSPLGARGGLIGAALTAWAASGRTALAGWRGATGPI
jgi:glucokinase